MHVFNVYTMLIVEWAEKVMAKERSYIWTLEKELRR